MFAILYSGAVEKDLRRLRAHDRRYILDEIDEQLTVNPAVPSRRKKKLEGVLPPWDQVDLSGNCGSETFGSFMMSMMSRRRLLLMRSVTKVAEKRRKFYEDYRSRRSQK